MIPQGGDAYDDKGKEAQSIFINARVRMGSLLLFHIAQKPVAGVPDRNRCRSLLDNAKEEVPAPGKRINDAVILPAKNI